MIFKKWEDMNQNEKYAAFTGAINKEISWIKQEIEKGPDKTLRVRAKDMANRLGPMFEKLDEMTIFWGVKYALFPEGIIVDSGREKVTEAYLLIMKKGKDAV